MAMALLAKSKHRQGLVHQSVHTCLAVAWMMVVEGQHIVSDIDFDIKGLQLGSVERFAQALACVCICVCMFARVHMCSRVCVCVTAHAYLGIPFWQHDCNLLPGAGTASLHVANCHRPRPRFSGLELEERHGRASRP